MFSIGLRNKLLQISKGPGTISWNTAVVLKVLEDTAPDSGEAIRKLVRKEEK